MARTTAYVVLKQTQGGFWELLDAADAASADAAVRATVDGMTDPALHGGEYVAVPERSWKPRKVTIEQTTRLRAEVTS